MTSPLPCLVPDWPGLPANVGALATVRAGGVSQGPYGDGQGGDGLNLGTHVGDDPAHVAANRARLAEVLPAQPAWLSQVHGVAGPMLASWTATCRTPTPVWQRSLAPCAW